MSPATDPTLVDLAVERAARKAQAAEAAPQLQIIELALLPQPVSVKSADARMTVSVPNDPQARTHPWLLVFEPAANAWHAVLLPPGSTWQIGPPTPEPPKLWTPGGTP